jgi:hypothetical protein
MIMDSNVVKFPHDASRRVHSRKPRRSKNGTPEERAEREAASTQATRAAILAFAAPRLVPDPEPPLARAHRCNPLRSQFLPISPAVTIAGKMAKHPEHLLEICQGVREMWLQKLRIGAEAARAVARELDAVARAYDALVSERGDFTGRDRHPEA